MSSIGQRLLRCGGKGDGRDDREQKRGEMGNVCVCLCLCLCVFLSVAFGVLVSVISSSQSQQERNSKNWNKISRGYDAV